MDVNQGRTVGGAAPLYTACFHRYTEITSQYFIIPDTAPSSIIPDEFGPIQEQTALQRPPAAPVQGR